MKLRLDGRSVRLRLRKSDVQQFAETGNISLRAAFTAERALTISLEAAPLTEPQISLDKDVLLVRIPKAAAERWTGSDEVGIYANCGAVQLIIEKEFRKTSQVQPEDADLYPNPRSGRASA